MSSTTRSGPSAIWTNRPPAVKVGSLSRHLHDRNRQLMAVDGIGVAVQVSAAARVHLKRQPRGESVLRLDPRNRSAGIPLSMFFMW